MDNVQKISSHGSRKLFIGIIAGSVLGTVTGVLIDALIPAIVVGMLAGVIAGLFLGCAKRRTSNVENRDHESTTQQ